MNAEPKDITDDQIAALMSNQAIPEAQTEKPKIKLLATCGANSDGQMPTRLAALLQSGMWDHLHPDDRGAFTELGEVRDTPSGKLIFNWLKRIYGE